MNEMLTLEEVAKHNKEDDLWMIIHGKVYDITDFINTHPGGADVLFESAGQDGSEAFDEVGHSQDSVEMLKPFLVGQVEGEVVVCNASLGESRFAKEKKFKSRNWWWLIALGSLVMFCLLQRRKWRDLED